MASDDSKFRELVTALDPIGDERPPSPGSDRYLKILENAMHADIEATTDLSDGTSTEKDRFSRHRRTRRRFTAAAAAVLVIAAAALVAQSANAPNAQATVSEAARALAEITSLEAKLTATSPHQQSTSHLRVNGDNFEIKDSTTYADGHSEASTTTVVDGVRYEEIEGEITRSPTRTGDRLTPFGSASEAVISAAMTGASVIDAGSERVGSADSTRFDVKLSEASVAALSALSPSELAWFELEYPDQVDSISIWIGDGVIRQVTIGQGDSVTKLTYSSFNSDITISAP